MSGHRKQIGACHRGSEATIDKTRTKKWAVKDCSIQTPKIPGNDQDSASPLKRKSGSFFRLTRYVVLHSNSYIVCRSKADAFRLQRHTAAEPAHWQAGLLALRHHEHPTNTTQKTRRRCFKQDKARRSLWGKNHERYFCRLVTIHSFHSKLTLSPPSVPSRPKSRK